MFDLFGGMQQEKFKEYVHDQCATNLAIIELLVLKGIVTEEEFIRAKQKAIGSVDQLVEHKKQEMLAAMTPKEQLMYKVFGLSPDA